MKSLKLNSQTALQLGESLDDNVEINRIWVTIIIT
jgi:hypothetical protein